MTTSAAATVDGTPTPTGGFASLQGDIDDDDDNDAVFVSHRHVPRRSTRKKRQTWILDVSAEIGIDNVGDEEADLQQPALWPPADPKYRVCVPTATSVLHTSLDCTTC